MSKTLTISWQNVENASFNISQQIRMQQLEFDMILAITRGGLIPAGLLSYSLGIKDIRTVSIEPYKEKEQQSIKTIQQPNFYMFMGKNVLIVDEILDGGETYAHLRKILKPVMDIAAFTFAVLFHKGIAPDPDFYGAKVPSDVWLEFPWS